MKKQILSVAMLLIFLPFNSFACGDTKDATYLNISATERREVAEDLLVANLRFEFEGEEAKDVQNKINNVMQKALGKAKVVEDINVSTEQYSVYKYHPRAKKGEANKIIWRGSQSLLITGKNSDKILQLTGDLQKIGLTVTGLNYVVSPEKYEEIRDSLMEVAIEKLMQRSKRVAKAIGADDIKIININIDAVNPVIPMQQNRMMSMSSKGQEHSVPVASPGQSQIYMTVSAKVLIKD
jgi:predicted secreted protein